MIRIFIDSSVFFSAVYSSTGASREILKQAMRHKITIVMSSLVLEEVEKNLKESASSTVPFFKQFLAFLPYSLSDPTKKEIEDAALCVVLKDAPILAAARKANVDYLVTLDRKRFVGVSKVAECANVDIVLPEEIIKNLRN